MVNTIQFLNEIYGIEQYLVNDFWFALSFSTRLGFFYQIKLKVGHIVFTIMLDKQIHDDTILPAQNRVRKPENSDSESVTSVVSDSTTNERGSDKNKRKHLFRRSISLRRSLLRSSQKKKQRRLEITSTGSVVVPCEGQAVLAPSAGIIAQSRPVVAASALCTPAADSGIEDNTTDVEMSSTNVSIQCYFIQHHLTYVCF